MPVELPKNFPATEADAACFAAFCGCAEDFAKQVWNEAAARGGLDSFGKPVLNFRAYLAGRAAGDRSRKAERRPATGKGAANTAPPWQVRKDLEEEERELAGRLHDFCERERDPAGAARLVVVKAELAKLKGRPDAIA